MEEGPLKFNAFKVDPHKVNKSIYQGDNFPFAIATCGDALLSAEYRLGTGISNGIDTANGLIGAIETNEKGLFINEVTFEQAPIDRYNRTTQLVISTHEKHVKELYEKRRVDLSPDQVSRFELLLAEFKKNPTKLEIGEFLFQQIVKVKLQADDSLKIGKYPQAEPLYKIALKGLSELEKLLHETDYELASFYNLKAKIFSNLETISKRLKKPQDAFHFIEDALKASGLSLEIVNRKYKGEQQEKLLAEFGQLHQKLKDKYIPYYEAKTATHTIKDDLQHLIKSSKHTEDTPQDEETKRPGKN